jgi:uncharacterized membrane protein YidH (DUF202 family)
MKKLILGSSVAAAILGFSQIALAAISELPDTFESAGIGGFIIGVNRVINYIVPFLVGLGVFVIIYGIFTYIRSADDEEKRTVGKQFMVWGVLAVFVMLSVWGLVSVLANTLSFENSGANIQTPDFTVTGEGAGVGDYPTD